MRRLTVIWLCMILLCGCGSQQDWPESTPQIVSQSRSEEKEQEAKNIVKELNELSKKEEITAIAQGEDSLLCVLKSKGKDKVYRLDLRTGNGIEKELPFIMTGENQVQRTEEHTVIYDKNRNVVVMDDNLNIVDEVTIKKEMAEGFDRNYCVLPHEKKIVYTREVLKNGEWYQEVNECNYNGKKKRQICKIEDATRSVGKVNEITRLVISEDEKTIFFFGLYFKTAKGNETSSPCFGRINRDTGDVIAVQEEKSQGYLMGNKMMFVDGLREKGIPCSGYITCLDDLGNQKNYSFRKKEESQEVTVSDKGTYYLSYERKDEGTTNISCYSFAKSVYQWEKEISHYVSELWYFEKEKMLLYSYYNDSSKLCFQKEDISK